MKLSVIIPTYNGALKLPDILNAVLAQSALIHEILVVVDGSTDNSLEILKPYQEKHAHLRVLYQDNGGRAKVRNYGAQNATGDLLLFFDDDMIPSGHCAEVHVKHHTRVQGSILTGAQIDKAGEGVSDFRKFKHSLSLKWSEILIGLSGQVLDEHHIFITAANFSLSKTLFDELGGFNEKLNDAEDYDLALRAFYHNIPLYYNHEAFAWHNDNVTAQSYIRRMRQYRKAQEVLTEIYPERANKYNVNEPTGIKYYFFKLFCGPKWLRLIDSNQLTSVLPRAIRYKLYDWVITANGTYFTGTPLFKSKQQTGN